MRKQSMTKHVELHELVVTAVVSRRTYSAHLARLKYGAYGATSLPLEYSIHNDGVRRPVELSCRRLLCGICGSSCVRKREIKCSTSVA